MAAAGRSLRIKYGLGVDPSAAQQLLWATRTRHHITMGLEREAAGARAAKETFPDFNTHFFKAEADTIETLLRLAEQK